MAPVIAPKAVDFGIGNVLVGRDPMRLYRQEMSAAEWYTLIGSVDLTTMNEEVDRGAALRDTVYETAARHPVHADAIRLWHDRWIEMFGPRITGTWAILEALQNAGIPIFALSNFGRDSFEIAKQDYPELTRFDQTFISGTLGLIKPDPKFYAHLERITGLSGSALFFTDDRADNIAAATARGWRGHVFTGAPALAARLIAEGLPLASDGDWS